MKRWLKIGGIGFAALIVLGMILNFAGVGDDDGDEPVSAETTSETTDGSEGEQSSTTATASPATTTTTTSPPSTTRATTTTTTTTTTSPTTTTTTLPITGSGTYFVPGEFAPGTYRVVGYWARLDNDLEIIDNDLERDGFSLLIVRETDSFIEISGEAVPLEALPVVNALNAEAGTYLVNIDIQPGLYRVTNPGGSAYGARLDAELDIIDNELSDGSILLRVASTDFAFQFTGQLELIEE